MSINGRQMSLHLMRRTLMSLDKQPIENRTTAHERLVVGFNLGREMLKNSGCLSPFASGPLAPSTHDGRRASSILAIRAPEVIDLYAEELGYLLQLRLGSSVGADEAVMAQPSHPLVSDADFVGGLSLGKPLRPEQPSKFPAKHGGSILVVRHSIRPKMVLHRSPLEIASMACLPGTPRLPFPHRRVTRDRCPNFC